MRKALFVAPLLSVAVLATSVQAAEEEKKNWQASAELGIILTSGNTESTSVKGKIDAKHELDSWSNQYIIDALFKEDEVTNADGDKETQKTADKYFLSAQGNYKLETKNDSLFVYAAHTEDKFGAFATISTVAAGYGTRLLESESFFLDADIGPGFTQNETQDGIKDDSFIVRGNADFQWVISESATFTQKLSIETGGDNTQTKSDTAIAVKINGSLQMKAGISLTNNSEAPADKEKTDTTSYVTLVYNF